MPTKNMRTILVTGATGQIGSELTVELRERYGNENVVAVGHKRKPSEKVLTFGPFEYVDITNKESLGKMYDIDTIYFETETKVLNIAYYLQNNQINLRWRCYA